MGFGANLWFQRQQARQLRALERAQAEETGQPPRKLTFLERHVLGIRDPRPRRRRRRG